MMYRTILVNKEHVLPGNFVPQRLITINEPMGIKWDESYKNKLVPVVYKAFKQMQKDALSKGFEIFVDSSYRSYEYQKIVFNNNKEKKGLEYATKYVAQPGGSEHQTGLAIDVIYRRNGEMIEERTGIESAPETLWLLEHAHKYGFILRYPKNKNGEIFNDITGFNFEPWHFRYVGPKAAKEIFDKGITLEEYYDLHHNVFDRLLMNGIHIIYR